ncbi:MAG: F0F1 ATP synthase subunit delta [Rhodocyclaceae bacterium]|nr:F0F1 ATP synthase subunit delta [Rhodocyclaceae bacterium]
MAEIATLARPYAEAAFRVASGRKALGEWLDGLQLLAGLVNDPRLKAALDDPKQGRGEKQKLVAALLAGKTADDVARLADLLVENGRLSAIAGELARQFELLKLEAESTVDAHVVSAYALSDAEARDLTALLESRYGRKVNVTSTIDPELIGGVRIAVGDEVIDASVRGRLASMALTLQR